MAASRRQGSFPMAAASMGASCSSDGQGGSVRRHRARVQNAAWWEQSPRLRLLTSLSESLERGDPLDGNSPAATAVLLVHGLLTSSRQGAITQAETLASATSLTHLCAIDTDGVVHACGGHLELWGVQKLSSCWGANTERAAHLELQLLEMLTHVCRVGEGRRRIRTMGGAQQILERLVNKAVIGARATALLGELLMEEMEMCVDEPEEGSTAPISAS